ncbi:MAG: deoxyribodipyrimidine photolyase, partial [Actinobacteria bacterium]|nr:deoxyribodipyrimidine photolyase [Actinomycetota bacterium]
FAKELEELGFEVYYKKAADTPTGLKAIMKEKGIKQLVCAEPSSFVQYRQLKELGAEFIENDFFLTSRALFSSWAETQKTFVMENFYRKQRVRLGILVEDGKPEGGAWNFDEDNRLPPPKNYSWDEYPNTTAEEIDKQVAAELGMEPSSYWETTRAGALKRLKLFVEKHLAEFGPYEDAVTTESWSLHHSVISPYINNGLLHPSEVIDAVVAKYKKGDIPINSAEGFIRQIIGWREYINGMYWFLGEDYREKNSLAANRKLLPLFVEPAKTRMNCVASEVEAVHSRGWTHHIPRLMILSNLALLTGTNPQEFLDWMREQFVDASEWVMVPNVIGMGVHADGGKMMTKPYAAGGAYISRMTNYCKGCAYNPKERTGDTACPFTTLYWDFLDRNSAAFAKNHRMFQQNNGLKRLSDLPEVRKRAKEVLTGLEKGEI